jgi:hypothetical protein
VSAMTATGGGLGGSPVRSPVSADQVSRFSAWWWGAWAVLELVRSVHDCQLARARCAGARQDPAAAFLGPGPGRSLRPHLPPPLRRLGRWGRCGLSGAWALGWALGRAGRWVRRGMGRGRAWRPGYSLLLTLTLVNFSWALGLTVWLLMKMRGL